MDESLLEKISIGNNRRIVTNKWKNNAVGLIVDILNDGNYRFVDCIIDNQGEVHI